MFGRGRLKYGHEIYWFVCFVHADVTKFSFDPTYQFLDIDFNYDVCIVARSVKHISLLIADRLMPNGGDVHEFVAK